MKPEQAGVQGLPRKACCGPIGGNLRLAAAARRAAGTPVGRVADERVAQMGEMDPDLMGASGLEPAFDQGGNSLARGPETFQRTIAGACVLTTAPDNPHALSIKGIAADLTLDPALGLAGRAPHHRVVGPLNGMGGELLGQARHHLLGFGRHQKAGRILVQAMNYARAGYPAHTLQTVAAMGDEGVDKGSIRIAGSRMDNKAGLLVDNDEMLVLIDDLEGNGLPKRFRRNRWGEHQDKTLFGFDSIIGVFYGLAPRADPSTGNQGLQARATELGKFGSKKPVEAPAGLCRIGTCAAQLRLGGQDVRQFGS